MDAVSTSDAEGPDEIVVFGQGETRQVQEVDAADIQILTPGSSPIKAIEKLPSVNVQASDPFGNYEWSTRVTIRAFNQSQLGFNLRHAMCAIPNAADTLPFHYYALKALGFFGRSVKVRPPAIR